MSTTQDQRTAGRQASPYALPRQGAVPPRAQVDYTDQASFSQGLDSSPYATERTAKRAAEELGELFPTSPRRGRQPGSVDDIRAQMRVIEGGAKRPQQPGERPSVSNQAARAQRAASRTVRPEPQPARQQATPQGAPQEQQPGPAGRRAPKMPLPGPQAARTPQAAAGFRPAINVYTSEHGHVEKPGLFSRIGSAISNGIVSEHETLVRRLTVCLTCAACVALTCITLYTPAQQLYSAMRENERLTDELSQNQERVEALQKSVSGLQTAEGVQDAARKEWGLVMPDEVSLSVENASYTESDTTIPDEVRRGSGQNTSTWVTDILDQVFAESGATTATESTEETATVSETTVDSATPEDGTASEG
jgi:cell division protein FtsB